ncbi:MAG: TIM barrel protein [Verrucomicrobiota bacterium]|nr:TIM barrel protein [Verrucomicrobiota bacterium]
MKVSRTYSRRSFVAHGSLVSATLVSGVMTPGLLGANALPSDNKLRFGLVTYQWGKDMPLPKLIEACERSGLHGVEARTQHAHGVEPSLSKAERLEVRQRFEDSPVNLIGYGSNAQFHENDEARLKANIALTKDYIRLMHDCGGSGVKVKPNGFPKGIAKEQTIIQIGRALNEVAAYGDDWGQEIRVEAHGAGTSDLPVMKSIFDVANHPNVGVCWNSNAVDVEGDGLEANFNLVRHRFGDTVHVRELNVGNYPYQKLIDLLVSTNYSGWVLLEARTNPKDKIEALREQRTLFHDMIAKARA